MDKRHPPLAGKTIVVTRARIQAPDLVEQIEAAGGQVIEFPTIEIMPPADFAAFDAAVEKIENYDWVFFTSVNAVEPFLARLDRAGKSVNLLERLRVGAIGPETAKRLAAGGVRVDLTPRRYQAEGILDVLTPETVKGKRVLIPRAAEARETLPEGLRAWGASVDVVIAYRTGMSRVDARPLLELLRQGAIDVITFTSSSTVRNFVEILNGGNLDDICGKSAIACIGPVTAETVARLGGRPAITATKYTMAGLTEAIIEHFRSHAKRLSGSGDAPRV
jgi:uroporphyrinogen III methyltransferase/synthase